MNNKITSKALIDLDISHNEFNLSKNILGWKEGSDPKTTKWVILNGIDWQNMVKRLAIMIYIA